MAKPIGGTAYISVDGEQLSLGGTLTVSISPTEREGQAGLSGPAGYIERPRVPYIEGEFLIPAGFPLEKIEAMTAGTVTAELATGRVAVLSEAWFVGPLDLNAAEGKSTIRFEGIKGEWVR